jgi:hypothetical protein
VKRHFRHWMRHCSQVADRADFRGGDFDEPVRRGNDSLGRNSGELRRRDLARRLREPELGRNHDSVDRNDEEPGRTYSEIARSDR